MPHYDELEAKIGEIIARKFSGENISKIEVLEIGPGSGITTKVLLDCDKRVSIIAVDNSQKMREAFLEKNLGMASRKQSSFCRSRDTRLSLDGSRLFV